VEVYEEQGVEPPPSTGGPGSEPAFKLSVEVVETVIEAPGETQFPTKMPTPAPSLSPTKAPTKAPTELGCIVKNAGSGLDQQERCIFPFTYKAVTYDACTDTDGDGMFWCSTKTDWWGYHVSGHGHYGTCEAGDSCYIPCQTTVPNRSDEPADEGETGLPRSPRQGAKCKFPFIYAGKTYTEETGCAPAPGESEFGWCSTLTDLFDHHIPGMGQWGYCSSQGCNAPVGTSSPVS